jgi:hypothetical protein
VLIRGVAARFLGVIVTMLCTCATRRLISEWR